MRHLKLVIALALSFGLGASTYIPLKVIEGGTSANIPISDGTKLVSRTMSGDVTIGSTGVTAVGATKITYSMLNSTAQPWFAVEMMDSDSPSGTGARAYEFRMPPSNSFGTSITWTLVGCLFRTSTTSSSGNPSINFQYSTGTGVFSSAGSLFTSNIAETAGTYETQSGSGNVAVPTLSDGYKVRLNIIATGTGTAGWSCILIFRRTA